MLSIYNPIVYAPLIALYFSGCFYLSHQYLTDANVQSGV